MRSALIVALASASLTGAQQVQNYTSSLNMTIDPNSVPAQQRAVWCGSESDTCNQLCDNNSLTNTCDPNTLDYDCTCRSNSSAPALQYYANSLPSNICFALFDQCNKQNIGDAPAQKLCKTNIRDLCGTQSAAKAPQDGGSSSSATSSAAATSSSAKATGKETGKSGDSTSTSSGYAAPTKAPGQGIAAAAAALGVFAYVV